MAKLEKRRVEYTAKEVKCTCGCEEIFFKTGNAYYAFKTGAKNWTIDPDNQGELSGVSDSQLKKWFKTLIPKI